MYIINIIKNKIIYFYATSTTVNSRHLVPQSPVTPRVTTGL